MNNNNEKSTNMMAILGFIFSLLFSLIGLILSILALKQIKTSQEGGKGLATAGLIISIIKLVLGILLIVLIFVSVVFSSAVWPSIKDSIIDSTKCSVAKSCEFDETSGVYNCYYDYSGEGEFIICDEESLKNNPNIDNTDRATNYSDYTDDEDFEDPFDYDREY